MMISCFDISNVKFEDAFHELEKNSIHIWLVESTNDENKLSAFQKTFDDDENKRTGRFTFEKDRNQFITTHGSLRKILSQYLSVRPEKIQFSHTTNRKPFIVFPVTTLKFNISHSENKILIAVSDNEIGVDIEKIKPEFAHKDVVEKYFTANEKKAILNAEKPHEVFYKLWTRKEAILKATGMGIAADLRSIEVCSVENGSPFNQHYGVSSFLIDSFYGSVASPFKNFPVLFMKYNF